MKFSFVYRLFVLISFIYAVNPATAQISEGGTPPGLAFGLSTKAIPVVELPAPVFRDVETSGGDGLKPLLVGKSIKTNIDFFEKAVEDIIPEGKIYRLQISSENAAALGTVFQNFFLPEGARLFIYNQQEILGAYTFDNNTQSGRFAVEPLKGSVLTIEYFKPSHLRSEAGLYIEEISYIFHQNAGRAGFGDSGSCEVNINCPEGADWKDEKRGVAKIILKDGQQYWLCTGSLVNNTALDNTPYLLTANHCGRTSTNQDYDLWIFYFNYEAEGCADPPTEPLSNTLTGAELLAASINDESFASDFKLLKLKNNIPDSYNPYFNGWDYTNAAPEEGVSIHHPQGDIKKISTFNSPAVSSAWQGSATDPEERYWKVNWSATATDHGVTEGGSSGSPLFNQEGYIVGTLTGGSAKCNDQDAPDYYGKFWYHWNKNGDSQDQQLQPWLDPENLGISSLKGMYINENQLLALFKSTADTVEIDGSTSFQDLSSGAPTEWNWYFEGATPSGSTEQNPANITYSNFGKYDVRLIISNGSSKDTLLKKNYIYVKPIVGPVPSRGNIEVFLGKKEFNELTVSVYDNLGRKVHTQRFSNPNATVQLSLAHLPSQLYILRLEAENYSSVHKIIIFGNGN